jgi:serine/threonine protein kinase
MKKSTGKHYAMKIQTKSGLLDSFKDDPIKVNLEKDAIASLQHPFIVNLYYAFQTPALAIMVLDLADAGDLHSCLAHAMQNKLPEDRVKFYMAEITLALAYLHQRGLIYRDLKPQNVLLNSDGHVQLVDLGGIMDDQGIWSQKQQSAYKAVLPLFSSYNSPNSTGEESTGRSLATINEGTATETESSKNDNSPFSPAFPSEKKESPTKKQKPKRKQSIMGTIG